MRMQFSMIIHQKETRNRDALSRIHAEATSNKQQVISDKQLMSLMNSSHRNNSDITFKITA
jgi:hypothetical protein